MAQPISRSNRRRSCSLPGRFAGLADNLAGGRSDWRGRLWPGRRASGKASPARRRANECPHAGDGRGLEATRQIKSRWPEIRIIVLTIYTACQARALATGADAFLVKGGQPEELKATLLHAASTGLEGGQAR